MVKINIFLYEMRARFLASSQTSKISEPALLCRHVSTAAQPSPDFRSYSHHQLDKTGQYLNFDLGLSFGGSLDRAIGVDLE